MTGYIPGSTTPYAADKRRPRGFTLIELLVVIGIISILVGMLLPALNCAKDLARTAVCMAGVKGIGTGFFLYAGNWDGWIPRNERFLDAAGVECDESSAVQSPTWNQHLTEYPKGMLQDATGVANPWIAPESYVDGTGIYACPSDPRPMTNAPWSLWGSYGLNWRMTYYETDSWVDNGHYRLTVTQAPSEMFLLGDAPFLDSTGSLADDVHTYLMKWDCTDFEHWEGSSIVHGQYMWHVGETKRNLAFHDGHVESLTNREIPATQHSSGWGGVPSCGESPCVGNNYVTGWSAPPWSND